jgi:hypothetical protein
MATRNARVESVDLAVIDNGDFGVVQESGPVRHERVQIERNGNVGLWVGRSDGVEILDVGSIADNGFAGLGIVDCARVDVDGLSVSGTREVVMNTSTFGVQRIGDGIVLSGTSDALIHNTTVSDNERVGLMVDLGGAVTDVRFESVTVSGTGDAFGALAGDRDTVLGQVTIDPPPGWDEGITRAGATIDNDVAASGALDFLVSGAPESVEGVYGIVAPMY